jgi:hypothetical protein
MTTTCNFHTSDLLNRHPLKVEFQNWPACNRPGSGYVTLKLSQVNEGEVTLFVRHSMYGDLIAGLEDAARQVRAEVAKEMVMTWGFPACRAEFSGKATDHV